MKQFWAMAALAVLGTAGVGAQQAKPDFSGTWKLDTLRSRFGDVPAPKSLVFEVEQHDPAIRITRTMATHQGDSKDVLDLTTDGQPHQVSIGGQPATVTAAWDGDHLLVQIQRSTPQGQVTSTRRFRMGDKHKVVTTVYTVANGSGTTTAYEFYTKQ